MPFPERNTLNILQVGAKVGRCLIAPPNGRIATRTSFYDLSCLCLFPFVRADKNNSILILKFFSFLSLSELFLQRQLINHSVLWSLMAGVLVLMASVLHIRGGGNR
jgi:hypothetical protein